MVFCSSAGVPPRGVAPWAIRACCMSGSATTSRTSAETRSSSACGVPAGASSATHEPDSALGTPSSANVGTSGMAGERCALVTARARSLPALT